MRLEDIPEGRWIVVDTQTVTVGGTLQILAHFATEAEAVQFLDTNALIDPAKLYAGDYGIDGPTGQE